LYREYLDSNALNTPVERNARREAVVSASQLGMVALVPDPQTPCYRLDVRLRQTEGRRASSWVGLFFGFRRCDTSAGRLDAVVVWRLRDLFDESAHRLGADRGDGRNDTELMVALHRRQTLDEYSLNRHLADPRFVPAARLPDGPRWRRLAVEVRRADVRVFLDGACRGTVPQAAIADRLAAAARLRRLAPPQPLAFDPRGPLGLVLHEATAEVAAFTVTPRSDKE
jgi:hypothetical protein